MSSTLIAELKAKVESAEETVKGWFDKLDSDAMALAAHLYADVTAGLTKVGTAIDGAVMAALPGFLSQLKSYAGTVVAAVAKQIDADLPEWLAGQVKFSLALKDFWAEVKGGGISFLGVALTLSETTVKTLIQTAASAALAGL